MLYLCLGRFSQIEMKFSPLILNDQEVGLVPNTSLMNPLLFNDSLLVATCSKLSFVRITKSNAEPSLFWALYRTLPTST
jgi:hypothetical protein